jgi:hypothetical protein
MAEKTNVLLLVLLLLTTQMLAQDIREYEVKKTTSALEIDGRLNEPQWQAADVTERFIHHQDGAATILSTRAKFLWDDHYLYVGFISEDPDVWGTLVNRDDHLWNGEVVEILCDPDGDGLNYFEVQVNPLETILDLTLTKAYSEGGQADLNWNLDSIKAKVWVDGTLNNLDSVDIQWQCEVALPFDELAFMGPTLNFPPHDGEAWRILVTRYDYGRTGDEYIEVSAWNQTNSSSFHVPERFGRIIFSEKDVVAGIDKNSVVIKKFRISSVYPNPFNPTTNIRFEIPKKSLIKMAVYNLIGQKIATISNHFYSQGEHSVSWEGKDDSGKLMASGIYLVTLESVYGTDYRKIFLIR